ncbi:MAG: YceI family protein [Planctomycetia bacterium]|nr:YceI family protein [Planctomycetia bacterium]
MNWRTALLVLLAAAMGPWVNPRGAYGQVSKSQRSAERKTFEPGDLQLDASEVFVFVGKTGFGHEHAIAGKLASGHLQLDASAPSGELVFELASFDADTDTARRYIGLKGVTDADTRRQVNDNMHGQAVLDVTTHPTAVFTLTSVSQLKEPSARKLPQYELGGEFTLHGVTRPIRVVADWEEKQGWIHLRGGFSMRQSDFEMTPFTKAFGAVGVTDELKVWGDFWIAKERRVVEVKTTKSNHRSR